MSGKSERASTKLRDRDSVKSGKDGKSQKATSRKVPDGPAAGTVIKTGQADESFTSRRGSNKNSEKTKRKGRTTDISGKHNKAPEKKKRRGKGNKRSVFEKIASMFGIYLGHVVLKDPRAVEAAQALDLQPWHLRKLRSRFDKIDIDGSGNIDLEEFFEAVHEERSPFTDKLFALIGNVILYKLCYHLLTWLEFDVKKDLDGSGTIEFDEYVRVMATYCMFTKDEILRFAFECFDVDRSGTIDEKEFVELCK